MKTKFPYCDQHDCKHYENCQSEQNITFRLLGQNDTMIELHNVCRDTMQSMWNNYERALHKKYMESKEMQ